MSKEPTKDYPFYEVGGEEYCDEEEALSQLLAEPGLLFIGGDHGPLFEPTENDSTPASIYINCNDLFFWACADEEPLPISEIGNVWKAWKHDEKYGVTKWACKRRNLQPQKQIVEKMKEEGTWDEEMEALPKSPSS